MSDPLIIRPPTPEENEEAKVVAILMNKALAHASNVPVGIGAISLLTTHAFAEAVKSEYLLAAFDLFAADIRQKLVEGLRRAHH
jgi:uncharacterized protein (UPF0254 family)